MLNITGSLVDTTVMVSGPSCKLVSKLRPTTRNIRYYNVARALVLPPGGTHITRSDTKDFLLETHINQYNNHNNRLVLVPSTANTQEYPKIH